MEHGEKENNAIPIQTIKTRRADTPLFRAANDTENSAERDNERIRNEGNNQGKENETKDVKEKEKQSKIQEIKEIVKETERIEDNLSFRDRRFAEGLRQGMTQGKAYQYAGYKAQSDLVAQANASRKLRKDTKIRQYLQHITKLDELKIETIVNSVIDETTTQYARDRLKAKEMLLKTKLGAYTNRQTIEIEMPQRVYFGLPSATTPYIEEGIVNRPEPIEAEVI